MANGRTAEQWRQARANAVLKCQYHCRACGSHFRSCDAFDAHRQFAEGHTSDWSHRICVEPEDEVGKDGSPRFKLATAEGDCRVVADWQGNGTLHGVRIWTVA